MKLLNIKVLLTLIAFMALALTSCEEDSDPIDPNAPAPVITSISDAVALAGQFLTIKGTDFGTTRGKVKFNGVEAPSANIDSWSDTQIVVVIPTNATSGKVTVVAANDKVSNGMDIVIIPTDPVAPPAIYAASLDATTVRIAWDPAPTEDLTVFSQYILKVKQGTNDIEENILTKTDNPYDVDGLTEGIVYTFEVYVKYTNGSISSTPATINWSPASRFTEVDDQTIRIYESASSFGSGLDLYDSDLGTPQSYTIGFSEFWNLGLETKSGDVVFGPASGLNYTYSKTPQKTEISDAYFEVNSINESLSSLALDQLQNGGFTTLAYTLNNDFPNLGNDAAVVFVVRTEETAGTWNYAKVLAKKVGGSWLQGTSPNRYLELVISYQKTTGVPYAKKPM